MGYNELYALLREWAESVKLVTTGYASRVSLARMIELGPDGAGFGGFMLFMPNFWPNNKVLIINSEILELSIKHRNVIVGRFVYNANGNKELAKICQCDIRTAASRMDSAVKQLKRNINHRSNASTT